MFRYAGLVDIGVHEDHNDDRALIDGRVLADGKAEGSTDSSVFHAAVCDGVGGAKQGARAAQLTAEKLGTLDAEIASALCHLTQDKCKVKHLCIGHLCGNYRQALLSSRLHTEDSASSLIELAYNIAGVLVGNCNGE